MQNEILEQMMEADMLLIGLGEEFDNESLFRDSEQYRRMRKRFEDTDKEWLLPAYQDMLRTEQDHSLRETLCKFSEILKDKDYFVVTTSTNRVISQIPWREGRFVAPCGNGWRKQCIHGCVEGLSELKEAEEETLYALFHSMERGTAEPRDAGAILGKCPFCGEELIFNNIYTSSYDEKGYLERWGVYTKWLQGTLNRRLFILELGVGMQCPTVIRFPFEKVAFYNQKAFLCRVNGTLYHLTENLREKGCSISENSVDWLQFLC